MTEHMRADAPALDFDEDYEDFEQLVVEALGRYVTHLEQLGRTRIGVKELERILRAEDPSQVIEDLLEAESGRLP